MAAQVCSEGQFRDLVNAMTLDQLIHEIPSDLNCVSLVAARMNPAPLNVLVTRDGLLERLNLDERIPRSRVSHMIFQNYLATAEKRAASDDTCLAELALMMDCDCLSIPKLLDAGLDFFSHKYGGSIFFNVMTYIDNRLLSGRFSKNRVAILKYFKMNLSRFDPENRSLIETVAEMADL